MNVTTFSSDCPGVNIMPVALAACSGYRREQVEAVVRTVLDSSGWGTSGGIGPGRTVLIKPNLLRAQVLACTHPEVVRAACLWVQDRGAKVLVGDSPGFGTVDSVAARVGLSACLRPLGVPIVAFTDSVPLRLPDGRTWGVARQALECDAILSVPKVKAHAQLRLTLAVKNLFGCVCGLRKAVAHTVQGQNVEVFAACVAALWAALPPSAGLADGITAMHVTGPSGGQPLELSCLGASACAVALDTSLYTLLGAAPEAVPLWQALQARCEADNTSPSAPHAWPEALCYPLLPPEAFAPNFILPEHLVDISFRPHRLLWSMMRRMWASLRARCAV